MLQLYWIPIRDWNVAKKPGLNPVLSCNYIESLLGIETIDESSGDFPTASCNYIESLLGIETSLRAIKFSRFFGVATILNPY